MKLYFTRHGKTRWNQEHRLQGRFGDSELLPSSFVEIEKLGCYLSDTKFHAVYSSPSLRARKTAEGIMAKSAFPVEVAYKEDLREFGLGELEGIKIDIAHKKYPQQMNALRNDLAKYDPSRFHGESVTSLLERFSHVVISAVLENKTNDPLLFISHGAALSAGIRHLAGFSLAQLRKAEKLENNTLSVLEAEAKIPPYKLIKWNDGHFL
ncbi:MAG: histidine phosphatase family protein [Streptococcaceae bacterium]|jgi:probable phosphoglycerate mutase|nr:histidine phosphatase family protein [Streptococcaceae bacterium]